MLPKVPSTKYLALFILILLPSMTGYMAWEARTVDVTVLEIEGAPEGIIYITDPHVRASNIDHVQMVIREVNRLNPSLVLIGGDFVTGDETGFASQSVWRSLDAPAYAVLGNHDYRVGTDAPTGLERIFAVRASADVTAAGYNLSALKDGSADTAFADGLTATLEKNGVHVLRNEPGSRWDAEVVIMSTTGGPGWQTPDVPEPVRSPSTSSTTSCRATGTPTSSSPATPTAASSSSRHRPVERPRRRRRRDV